MFQEQKFSIKVNYLRLNKFTKCLLVQSIVLACDALGGPFPVTTLRVALGVAVVQYLSRGVERLVADLGRGGGRVEGGGGGGVAR